LELFDHPLNASVSTILIGPSDGSGLLPSVVPPSPPRNVRLSIVSDGELGVSFEQPLFAGGGGPVTKYLVEYSKRRTFPHDEFDSTVSLVVSEPDCDLGGYAFRYCEWGTGHSDASSGGLVHRVKLSPKDLLESGTPYFVRVRAFTSGGRYGYASVSAPEAAIPTLQLPPRPSVSVAISPIDAND